MPVYSGKSTGGRKALGSAGEAAAVKYLQRAGYEIVETNYRTRTGEIDIVARDGQTCVFVEVKARSGLAFGRGAEAVDSRKRARIVKVAEEWLFENEVEDALVRFDVVALTRSGRGDLEVELIKDAFQAEWAP